MVVLIGQVARYQLEREAGAWIGREGEGFGLSWSADGSSWAPSQLVAVPGNYIASEPTDRSADQGTAHALVAQPAAAFAQPAVAVIRRLLGGPCIAGWNFDLVRRLPSSGPRHGAAAPQSRGPERHLRRHVSAVRTMCQCWRSTNQGKKGKGSKASAMAHREVPLLGRTV